MTSIRQRLLNLWRLSAFDLTKEGTHFVDTKGNVKVTLTDDGKEKSEPINRPAVIIHMRKPSDKFLNK